MRKWEVPWIVRSLTPAAEQQDQQQDQADDTGGQCKGQQHRDPFTCHTDEKYNTKFYNQIHNDHLGKKQSSVYARRPGKSM